jgi:hypothetical protein
MRSENGFNRKLVYDRIPPTIGILWDVFGKLRDLGKELVDLHLLGSAALDAPEVRFQGEAGPVGKIRYAARMARIFIAASISSSRNIRIAFSCISMGVITNLLLMRA